MSTSGWPRSVTEFKTRAEIHQALLSQLSLVILPNEWKDSRVVSVVNLSPGVLGPLEVVVDPRRSRQYFKDFFLNLQFANCFLLFDNT